MGQKSKKKAATRKEDEKTILLDVLGCETALFRANFPDDEDKRIKLIDELDADLAKIFKDEDTDIAPEYANTLYNMAYALFTDVQARMDFMGDMYVREAEEKAGKRKASEDMPNEEEKAEMESGVAEDMNTAWMYSELARKSFELRMNNAKEKGEDAKMHMRDLAMVMLLQGEINAENEMLELAETDVRGAIEGLALSTDEKKPIPCQLEAVIQMATLVLMRKEKEQQQEVLDYIAKAKAILELLQKNDALVSAQLDDWREAILGLEQDWDEIKNMTEEDKATIGQAIEGMIPEDVRDKEPSEDEGEVHEVVARARK
ncbi:hypothetical protein J8273_0485 [Carpediemonas membranifera]|uniref:Uncharacterized protein n=1 Tax=Carpediemonas membranifera TaxID=201153 RepID=A0A8J6AVJ3_9EUKA|nr:hypothetical protein J8273_0485 [Carpediemonas membranifera]|eukprot:KAG9395263.1 hypothetical protein J8273_0485 [Carpediemonas membranifera]